MKINEMIQSISSILDSKKIEKGKPGEIDFQEILRDANGKLNDGSSMIGLSCPDSGSIIPSDPVISSLSLNGLLGLEDITQIQSEGIRATESTLDRLEEYQKALGHPEIPLKKIDRLIQSLSEEVRSLNILSEKLPPSDPLQKILTEVGIVTTAEIERFRRGEYI